MAIDQEFEKAALEFPDSPVGRRAKWYTEARGGLGITKADVNEHFSPSFTSGWGSPHDEAVLAEWVSRWAQFKTTAEAIHELTPFEMEITWRFPGGARQRNRFHVEESPPHRILGFDNANRSDMAPPPVDFETMTEVIVSDKGSGFYKARVHLHLVTPMGPFGGYIAAIALRAAGAHTTKPKPLSMSLHFVNPGKVGELEAQVTTLRSSSRLESMRVELLQEEKVLIEALVWATTEQQGPEHVRGDIAEVPRPESVLRWQDLFPGQQEGPFQKLVEGRPLLDGWQPPGEPPWQPDPNGPRLPAEAHLRSWVRMIDCGPTADLWIEAAKTLVPFDWVSVNASVMPHRGQWIQTPSLDTTIAFHNLEAATEWMLVDSESPIAHRGFATATASIWSESGALVAIAMQQVMQRVVSPSSSEG